VISDEDLKDDLAGSTANIVLIKDNKIYCVSWSLLIFPDIFSMCDFKMHFSCLSFMAFFLMSQL